VYNRRFAEDMDLAPCGNNRWITDRSRPKIVQHVLLCESLACFVVLHVVVGKDPRQHVEIGTHQCLVSGFVQRQNLLFVILYLIFVD